MADRSFLEWPFFEAKHRELADAIETWCATHTGHESHVDLDEACRSLVKALGEGDVLDCVAPDPGRPGDRIDVRSLCIIRETLARHSGLADFAFALQGLGSGPIWMFGTDALKQRYLPDVRAGRKIAAFALSEPDAGSDVAALGMTAVREGQEYVLNGQKTWISNGGIADFYTVFARTGEGPGARGLTAFVVDADTPNLSISDRIQVIAPHPLARLDFAGVRVPASNVIGKPGEGFRAAMATLDIFRPSVGAAALGFARRALDETLRRTTGRTLFGAPLADMQLTQAKLAQMAVEVDASALLIYRAAWAKDRGAERITREAAMAKMYATEAAQRVVDDAVQLFGALGVVQGVPVEQLYREVRALRIYEGATEVQLQIIARQVLAAFEKQK